MAKRAVYTALLGGYEKLNEQPVAKDSGIPFICFTDDASLSSQSWQIVVVEPLFPFDLTRSQRNLKIRGHELLDEFEETLYIDNSVTLKVSPGRILDEWLADSDFALIAHSFRDTVIDEFEAVVANQLDEPSRVQEQLLHYAELYPTVLEEKPHWNAILARRNTTTVKHAMTVWFDHVLRYSRRDQLSGNVAFAIADLRAAVFEHDNRGSVLHEWPTDVGRKPEMVRSTNRRTGPLLAEVARLRQQTASLEESLARQSASLAEVHEVLSATTAQLGAVTARLGIITGSPVWKLIGPIWRRFAIAKAARREKVTKDSEGTH